VSCLCVSLFISTPYTSYTFTFTFIPPFPLSLSLSLSLPPALRRNPLIKENPFFNISSKELPWQSAPLNGGFDVAVDQLPTGYGKAIRRAADEGQLNAYRCRGRLFVNSGDLFELAGPGADLDDPTGGCYVPPDAYLTIAEPPSGAAD